MFTRQNRHAVPAVVGILMCVALLGCYSPGSVTGGGGRQVTGLPQSSDPTLEAGRKLIQRRCSWCHTLDRVEQAAKDRAGWEITIQRMRRNGLVTTDAEVRQMLDYLESR